jgi:hypothetical protein
MHCPQSRLRARVVAPSRLLSLATACVVWGIATPAAAVGTQMFTTVAASTGEKPQSKLWYHDGSYWAILRGPSGVAFYEKTGSNWQLKTFANAVLASSGNADVKWNGTDLFVLRYAATTQLYKYSYAPATRAWVLVTGFPVTLPNPSGSETMVLEQDSTGRLWTTAEGGGNINVYYSTSADHRTWASSPFVLRNGVDEDDISSIIAFGGNKIGVFWSDQTRWEFGFRVHQDGDPATSWGSVEVVIAGDGVSDDHVNLAADATGRVYAVTKDAADAMRVHRRATNGAWTTRTGVLGGGTGTRGIIQVSDADAKVYILFTRWGVTPERIEHRVADMATLTFGSTTNFISTTSNMNNVTGLKQPLPAGNLIAVAENGSHCWFNSVGSLPNEPNPPGPPGGLVASLAANPTRVELDWQAPASGTPDGYNVYRQVDGGTLTRLNGALVTSPSYIDASPPAAPLCYNVRAVAAGLEGAASSNACVDNTPLPPPGAPQAVAVELAEIEVALQLDFDEASGQTASDASGNGNDARLGSSAGADNADPVWVAGTSGNALQFDGSNDYIEVADAPSLDMPGSFTVAAWVRVEAGAGTGTLVSKGDSGERTVRIRIVSGTDIEFRWDTTSGSSRTLSATDAIADDAWHHIVCTYDRAAGENRIYVDAELAASGSATGTPAANAAPLHIGARDAGSLQNFLEGAVDAFQFMPGAANGTAVLAAMGGTRLASKGSRARLAAQRATVTWQAPGSGAPAVGYHVERAVDGGAFTRLTSNALATLSFEDGTLSPGAHCYRVVAINAQALEGPASIPACADVLPPIPAAPAGLTAQLHHDATSPPAAVAAYDFDAGSGGTVDDVTGNGHTALRGSGVTQDNFDPYWTAGAFANALGFDGSNDRCTIAAAAALDFAADFTVEAWVYVDSVTAAGTIVSKGRDDAIEYLLGLTANGAARLAWHAPGGVLHEVIAPAAFATRLWHHLAGVYDAAQAEARLYIDGQVVATNSAIAAPESGQSGVALGALRTASGWTQHFRGSVDLVRLTPGVRYDAAFAPPGNFAPPVTRRVEVAWTPHAGALVAGYNVYRQVEPGPLELLNPAPIAGAGFSDLEPPDAAACYRVAAVDTLGREGAATAPACVAGAATDSEDAPGVAPLVVALAARPNPFNPSTTIAFDLPRPGHVRLSLFDARGRRVARLVDAIFSAGSHAVPWHGRSDRGAAMPAGVYFADLEAGGERLQRKLILVK